MSVQPSELINQLAPLQEGIWQTVSKTVSEAAGQEIQFASPLCMQANPQELIAEFNAPVLAVQFAFGGIPESQQVVLLTQETFVAFASLVKQELVESADENLVADVRPALEALVQGLCLSIGENLGEPVVATGLTFRFQNFAFPQNMQRGEEIARTQIAMSGEDLNGTAIWLMDFDSVAHALAVEYSPEIPESPFSQVAEAPAGPAVPFIHEETAGMELVRDIPLEITVELGRVKMLVKDVLELGTGSIVEIDKAAGEPVDVLVNGLKVARGEVVVIEDNFGVRITEVINPNERLGALGEVA
ncbi:MAG: flagellar motor switch protein FliN [Fimbriimonadaceae bacterium]|nr:flagellar motor switch protein FliN [Fimbriimonadaceae bacterium]